MTQRTFEGPLAAERRPVPPQSALEPGPTEPPVEGVNLFAADGRAPGQAANLGHGRPVAPSHGPLDAGWSA